MQRFVITLFLFFLLSCKKDKSFLQENKYDLLIGRWERNDEYIEFYEDGRVEAFFLVSYKKYKKQIGKIKVLTFIDDTSLLNYDIYYISVNPKFSVNNEFSNNIEEKRNLENIYYIMFKGNYNSFNNMGIEISFYNYPIYPFPPNWFVRK